jgi:pyruvate dehydrogenase E2 component (dihydrolipoamide acetyltransferase)
MELRLPELGEGIVDATVVNVPVKAGQSVRAGDTVIEVETEKASMPIPAATDGMVAEIRVKRGDKIKVGAVIAILGDKAVAETASPAPAPAAKPQAAPAPAAKPQAAPAVSGNGPVAAGPATRRYARQHGVNLVEVRGSARGGRVTVEDVRSHIRAQMTHAPAAGGAAAIALSPLPDFSRYGPIEKAPLSTIRKKIAENLTLAWHAVPAVTQLDLADITELEAGRKRIAENAPKGAPKVTMTVLAVKAIVAALRELKNFNASLDLVSGEVVFKQYYHIGIAVDTERGLVVPVVRDADRKSVRDLAAEIATLADKARLGKLAIEEMRGGTFTITNLGGIGGTAFSPIVNYPEVAILGLARASMQPVYKDGQFVPRLMMPLCLTYDHRIIDGADAARFTTRLVQLFSDPIRLLMES